jgi:glycosyltransferase involved in cell wall biosynthesis
MKKKICFIISNLDVGGAELSLFKITLGLKHKFDFTIICLSEIGIVGEQLKSNDVKVISLGCKNNFSFINIVFKLFFTIKSINPDIVHTWMYHSDFFGGIISRIAGVKKVYWNIRNTDLRQGVSFLTRIIGYSNALFSYFIPAKIVLVSNSSKIYHSKIGYCKNKMIVIPNGYDVSKHIKTDVSRNLIRRELLIPETTILIGSIGRFNKYKDHHTFLRTAIRVLDNIDSTLDVRFLLIGRNVLSSNPQLFEIIKNSKHLDKFYLVGEKTNINDYFSTLDIFCLHSISEGFPNVLAEAMATGLPCLSTNVGDAKNILSKDEFIALSGDFITLSNMIINLISLDEFQLNQIGLENRNRIKSTYSSDLLFSNYNKLYNL